MKLGCNTAFVAIADLDGYTLRTFYQALLGINPTIDQPGQYAEFQVPGLRIGLFKPKDINKAEFADSSKGSLSICLEVDHLETAIAHLKTLGYPPTTPIQSASHGREIYIYDPQGNRLILHESRGVGVANT
ncbi:MAG TPA: VOC family protein, partial [Stenomitos sp.]